MTDKELRKLKREDLMEILLEQSREIKRLKKQLAEVQAELDDKRIRIEQAGSIAEASLKLSGVFEAAEAACRQYTENIELLSRRQNAIIAKRESESREAAERILSEARKKADELERDARERCEKMLKSAARQTAGTEGAQ